jgi:hypothetical protein
MQPRAPIGPGRETLNPAKPQKRGPWGAGLAAEETPAGEGQASSGAKWDPLATSPELRKLFEVWAGTDLKAQIIVFFHNNPGVIETVEGLSRRLGIQPAALREALSDPVHLGLLEERRMGDKVVLIYNPQSAHLQDLGMQALRKRMEGAS